MWIRYAKASFPSIAELQNSGIKETLWPFYQTSIVGSKDEVVTNISEKSHLTLKVAKFLNRHPEISNITFSAKLLQEDAILGIVVNTYQGNISELHFHFNKWDLCDCGYLNPTKVVFDRISR